MMSEAIIGDIFTSALYIVLAIVVVIIVPSLIIGLMVSTFQAATQINEQTLSFLQDVVDICPCVVPVVHPAGGVPSTTLITGRVMGSSMRKY